MIRSTKFDRSVVKIGWTFIDCIKLYVFLHAQSNLGEILEVEVYKYTIKYIVEKFIWLH